MTARVKVRLLALLAVGAALFAGCSNTATGPDAGTPIEAVAPILTRTYYMAADEIQWDYAPSGINQITGQPFTDEQNVFVQNGPDRIGKTYIKAQYREYTDAAFAMLKPIPAKWQHLGIMGPMIRGVVGDSIRIVFKNNLSIPTSLHVHGLQYVKRFEGAGYADGTGDEGDAIAPGETYTYMYFVAKRSGPSAMDGSSIMWMYHPHVNEPADTNAGLVGPILVTARAWAKPDGSPADVDREFINVFTVFDENSSHYLQQNIDTFCGVPASVNPDDGDFQESNLMHTINGYVYGNLPGLTMRKGERVRWYLMGMGTEVDLHTPHWHGATVTIMGMRTDVASLLPMSMQVADMVPDVLGTWLYHCHVNDHIIAGMMAKFTVTN